MRNRTSALLVLGAAMFPGLRAEMAVSWPLEDYLGHRWNEEIIHFDFCTAEKVPELALFDGAGQPVPCQFSEVSLDGQTGLWSGKAWTVVSLGPGERAEFQLRRGARSAGTLLTLRRGQGMVVLQNDRLKLTLPDWFGLVNEPVRLSAFSAPLFSLARPGGSELGEGRWVNRGPPLLIECADTNVLEQGPVRVTLQQELKFRNGGTYRMKVSLGARQEAALIEEFSTVDAPEAAFVLSLRPGLNADRVLWQNQWKQTPDALSWSRVVSELSFEKERKVCELRPWSFWWLGNITEWAGFYRRGADPFVGVLALRPSRWSPHRWKGFDRTAVPVISGPGPRLDVRFGLLAWKKEKKIEPLRRSWALVLGSVEEHINAEEVRRLKELDGLYRAGKRKEWNTLWNKLQWIPRLRYLLLKYSEFPLDEVKDYGFEIAKPRPGRSHPFLLFSDKDLKRVRRQARTDPGIRKWAKTAGEYVRRVHPERTLEKDGWQAYYRKKYMGNYLVEKLPVAYISSGDPLFSRCLAAAVKGLTRNMLNMFIEKPSRPAIGAYGPWFSEHVMRLLLNYDLVAGKGLLSEKEEAAARYALVFGAHFLAHPDYWNTSVGLASANPNMTSSIRLPLGLTALFLNGHPESPKWLKGAEDELKRELKGWVAEGGAWIENPGYQAASLDGMFLLAQAIKNVHGRNYFDDANFKATMDYYGFLLTPPDCRFPNEARKAEHPRPPRVLPSIGDMFAGRITPFNGWMAQATARSDPAFSARQQFFWLGQNAYRGRGGRAKGMILGVTDPGLPERAPAPLARSFPGFGAIFRSSWTDPNASYVAHRTGPYLHHYHDDYNSIVYYAKGAPLCTDFGDYSGPKDAWFHNRVSFSTDKSPRRFGSTGEIVRLVDLGPFLAYSYGKSRGGGNQEDHRHLLSIYSDDPLGANYLVARDATVDGQPRQQFFWNLYCLSGPPKISPGSVHFPGQLGVDLDVTFLSPPVRKLEPLHRKWQKYIYVWGPFSEEQYGIRATKTGSKEDFLAVLYPRTKDQPPAALFPKDRTGFEIAHSEGEDLVLFSPGRPAEIESNGLRCKGEIALARKYSDGRLRLAIVQGRPALSSSGNWTLSSKRPVAIEINGKTVRGTFGVGSAEVTLEVPIEFAGRKLLAQGRPVPLIWQNRTATFQLPATRGTFELAVP